MNLKAYNPDRDLLRLARDLAVVQALRRGVDVPEWELGEVRDLGQVMVALEEAESAESAESAAPGESAGMEEDAQ